jgi:hypothetical protein
MANGTLEYNRFAATDDKALLGSNLSVVAEPYGTGGIRRGAASLHGPMAPRQPDVAVRFRQKTPNWLHVKRKRDGAPMPYGIFSACSLRP